MLISIFRHIALRPYYIALIIVGLLVLWMMSAPVQSELNEKNNVSENETQSVSLPKVETTRFTPQEIIKELSLYAKSEANSHAIIRAEVAGKIVKVAKEKGDNVKINNTLVNIEKNELPERLAQAQAQLVESKLNYDAAKSLNTKGLQGRASVAAMETLYLNAKTNLKQLTLQLQRTDITAPFSGVLQEQFSDLGDYLQVGDPIFSLANTNPIIIRGDTTEHFISQLRLGQSVSAILLSGETITGKLSYIASTADSASSTFRIEAEFENSDLKIFSGVSAQLIVPLYPVQSIYVSPSTLAMDENGNLGVKLVKDGVVVFHAIDLVEADNNGVWLTGFDGPVDIITRGQGFVKPGAKVDAIAAKE